MAGIDPFELEGLTLRSVAKLSAVDMTTSKVYNVLNGGPFNVLLTHIVFSNFSAFPIGQAVPGTWTFSLGRAATTASAPSTPTDILGASSMSGKIPYLLSVGLTSTDAHVLAGETLYFAVVTTTNGVGTFDATFIGGVLKR